MTIMLDQNQTGIYHEADRTSENGDSMYLILQIYLDHMIVRQWEILEKY